MTTEKLPSHAKRWRPHKYSLGLDWETSGYSYPNYAAKHQGISLGVLVYELATLAVVEKAYYEVKFDESKYTWDTKAEEVHGISREHLAQHGMDPMEVAGLLGNLVFKYWADGPVMVTAYNPDFDLAFTEQLLGPFEIMFTPFYRKLDVSIATALMLGTPYSDDLFHITGMYKRDKHNALEDIEMTIKAMSVLRERLEAGKRALDPSEWDRLDRD